MKIAMIGGGYVGLVSAACFAELGHDVICIERDVAKVEQLQRGEIPIYEPGLDVLVARNAAAGRLVFSDDLGPALDGAVAIFIAVGTPSRRGDGHADLRHVLTAAHQVAAALRHDAVVVTKSTVPVGSCRRLQALFGELRPDLVIDVASNPEFLREGSAISDFLHPDRVICGIASDTARTTLDLAYGPLNLNRSLITFTNLETAELIKYATNSFLATKITFINEMADLCEQVGADVNELAVGLGLDGRIGGKFLHAGPGYGGSCFPKDTLALLRTAEHVGVPLRIVETVVAANEARKRRMVGKILDAAGTDVRGKTIGMLGVTFKPNTDDMRESPSLVIVPALQAEGAQIVAYDPAGAANAADLLPGVRWARDAYNALEEVDVAVLLTEWNQFRGLDLNRIARAMRGDVFVDLRNVYDEHSMQKVGLRYTGVGIGSEGLPLALEQTPSPTGLRHGE